MYGKDVKGNTAKAMNQNARVSSKSSKFVCRAIKGMEVHKAKKFLEDLIDEKRSLNGKYYTNISMEILELIKSAEKNAEFKNLDAKSLFIAHIASMKGTTMRRRRHKNKIGNKIKATHLEVILKERAIPGAEKKIIEKAGEKKEVPKAETKVESPKAETKETVKEAIKEKIVAEVKKKEENKAESTKAPAAKEKKAVKKE